MSSAQWGINRKNSPSYNSQNSMSKQPGPMKATLPVSSLTRNNAGKFDNKQFNNSESPLSPTFSWKGPAIQSGLRSPGAAIYKAKNKMSSEKRNTDNSIIRRTASLDAIYLSGRWPRETLYLYGETLQVDRSTQTDDFSSDSKTNQKYLEQSNEDKLDKFIRHRLRNGGKGYFLGGGCVSFATVGTDPYQTRHKLRSSIEGLNQEIERLVLKSSSTSDGKEDLGRKCGSLVTPEGHRAPLAELLRQTRSVNTQTPAYSNNSTQSSGPPSRESGSPSNNKIDSRPSSDLHGCSEDSSPEHESKQLGTSPRINKFLAREPPDGCERVSLKFTEDSRKPVGDISEIAYPPLSQVNFQLRPSLGSAFQPLFRQTVTQPATTQ